jgi:hypothetical protein
MPSSRVKQFKISQYRCSVALCGYYDLILISERCGQNSGGRYDRGATSRSSGQRF